MNDIGVLLNCIDEAILIVDREGTILEYNKAFSTLTDFNGRSFIGRNLKDIIASGLLRESAAPEIHRAGKESRHEPDIRGRADNHLDLHSRLRRGGASGPDRGAPAGTLPSWPPWRKS